MDPYDNIGYVGNGALRIPLYEQYSNADFADLQTTYRATGDAMRKAVIESLMAAGAILKEDQDEEAYTGAGWNVLPNSSDHLKFVSLYEAWLRADAILWNRIEKSKIHFSPLNDLYEIFEEGTLTLIDLDKLKVEYGAVPADWTGGDESFNLESYVLRGKAYVKNMGKILQSPDLTYTLTNEDKSIDTSTYFTQFNNDLLELQSATAALLNSVGLVGKSIGRVFEQTGLPGTVYEYNSWDIQITEGPEAGTKQNYSPWNSFAKGGK